MAVSAALAANAYYIGVLGLFLVLLGWAVQSAKTFRDRKYGISKMLSGLYALGSALLFAYSYSIGDYIFMALNAIAAILGAINFFFPMRAKSKK